MTQVTRLLIVSDAASIHTARWANAMAARGLAVTVASTVGPGDQAYRDGVEVVRLVDDRPRHPVVAQALAVARLRRVIARTRPDVVNSHYASTPALLANLAVAGRLPHLLSVWGRDVWDIPAASGRARALVVGNLRAATAIASTSRSMAAQTRTLVDGKQMFVTPFGIDLDAFPPKEHAEPDAGAPVRIGTIKTMSPKYGIDTLVTAFATVRAQRPGTTLELYGAGAQRAELEALVARLGVEGVTFHGPIAHAGVPAAMRSLDVYAALSRLDSESFGVAILEASASGVPVVVSDASGPAEVTVEATTGFIVRRDDPAAAAERLLQLVDDAALRRRMGEAGRRHVEDEYAWPHCVDLMLEAYARTVEIHRASRRGRVLGRLVRH